MKKKSAYSRRRPDVDTRNQKHAVVSAPRAPWLTVGTLLASAALQGAMATSLHAAGLAPDAPLAPKQRSTRWFEDSVDPVRLARPRLPEFGYEAPGTGVHAGISTDLMAAPWSAVADTAVQQPSEHSFAISPGRLADVLAEFSKVTGIEFTFDIEDLATLHSPGVSGRFAPEAALQILLAGTGAGARFTTASRATIELAAQSASVDVVGRSVTVSSPKYVVPVREIPQTVAVIPREVIEAQAATTVSEALRNVPGITMQAGEGGGASSTAGDMFNLRGFSAANSLFVDGVRDDGLISRDTFNLEQVEVFMGPSGTDIGRGTAAGYVNMQTKAPLQGSNESVNLSIGTANQKRFTADINESLPVGDPDRWLGRSAFRLNALWQDSGMPGRDVASRESKSFAPSLALGIGTPTRVVASAQVVRQNNMPDYGVPGAAWTERPLAPTTIVASAPVDQTNFYGSALADYDEASQDSVLARVEHDISPRVTLRNQTRYNQTSRDAAITAIQNVAAFNPTTNLVTLTRQGNVRENSILSNITSLVGRFATGRFRHAATAGVELTTEEQRAPGVAGLGTKAPVDIFAPDANAPIVGLAPTSSGAYSNGSIGTAAAYASDAVDLSRDWQLSGGVRAERYSATFDSMSTAAVRTEAERADLLFSGKAGLLYRLSPSANLYASVATTKTPPGTTNFLLSSQPNNQNNPNLLPMESTNVEVGGKWDTRNGRLSTTAAVFRTVNRNVIYTIDATAIPPLFNQDDEQAVRGASLGMTGRITEAWNIFANAAYLDSESRSQNSANNGRQLPLTPEFSGSIWTTYRLPRGLTVGGGLSRTGAVYVNAANTIRVPGYQLVDLVAEYPVNTHLSLRLNVSNVGNVTYIRNANNNGGRYNPGYSRAALLTTSVRF
jgi:catecholate siderophore receptor